MLLGTQSLQSAQAMPYKPGICVGLAGFVIDLNNGNGDPYDTHRDGKFAPSQLLGQRIFARHFLRYPAPHICSAMRKSSLRTDWDCLCFLTHDFGLIDSIC